MPSYQTKALVLKKTKLGETDLIITLLGEDGLQRRAVAKGARKPGSFLAARLELYMLVEAQLSTGRSLDIFTDARILEANAACRSSVEYSAAAAVPVELVERATTHYNAEPLLFAMTLAALQSIGEAKGSAPVMVSLACTLKLCAALGVRPDAEGVAFQDEVLTEWVETLLQARFADLHVYSGDEYLPIERQLLEFSARWIEEHLDIRLKSLRFLESLIG
ncbi:MAG: DNA repair protein RecO [Coriobacteriia bacterium]|nr:DNA repair protein RecO [Coriobacteriia bacterium]MCL2749568.1 DNA repair protein RecO [Coriobacteriia bacterium]